MTFYIALVAFALSLFTFAIVLMNPGEHASEDEWNEAIRNFRREWDAWKLNRAQDYTSHADDIYRAQAQIREQLAKHIRTAHLGDDPEQSFCNCGLPLGHLPAIYCRNPGPAE